MAILVVCRSCHSRFKVSDEFAGRKGPCPKCKTVIVIPKKDEQVEIHTPEHSEAGARGRSGQHLLKPIARAETKVPIWAMGAIAGAVIAVFGIALAMRGASSGMQHLVAFFGVLLLAPPLVLAAYAFLRNDELEPYTGKWLWIRTGICAAVYALCWGIYFLVPADWTDEFWKWLFLGPAFGAAGATAAFACFDLDFASGFFHFAFFAAVTALLGMTMGFKLVGG